MKTYIANDGRAFDHEFELKFYEYILENETEVEKWLTEIAVPKSNRGLVILDSCVLWLKR